MTVRQCWLSLSLQIIKRNISGEIQLPSPDSEKRTLVPEITCIQQTTLDNVWKLNTDNFGYVKQTHKIFLEDTRKLAHCYPNFTKMHWFQQVYHNFHSILLIQQWAVLLPCWLIDPEQFRTLTTSCELCSHSLPRI